MAQEADLATWAAKAIKKEEVRTAFCQFFDEEIGATSFADLADIYETDDWYELIADKDSGKQLDSLKEQFNMPIIAWKKFVKEVVKAKNGGSPGGANV